VRADETIECWGNSAYTSAPSGSFVEVSAGGSHSCALRADGKVECWGSDDLFQLHPPLELAPVTEPPALVAVGGDSSYDDEGRDCLRAGTTHGCELDQRGRVTCWGDDLGASPSGEFVDLSVGPGSACALRADGAVACWGNIVVEPGSAPTTYSHIAVGYALACALGTNGRLDCWEYARPDDGFRSIVSPGPPPVGTFIKISVSTDPRFEGDDEFPENRPHACALTTDGSAHCWGYLGNNPRERIVPGPFVQVSAGHTTDCALDGDGVAWCWATRTPPPMSGPTALEGEYSKVGVGRSFYGLRTDGTIVDDEMTPLSDAKFADLSVAGDFACGIVRDDGRMRCFGSRVR